jgi:hypothetical protein
VDEIDLDSAAVDYLVAFVQEINYKLDIVVGQKIEANLAVDVKSANLMEWALESVDV